MVGEGHLAVRAAQHLAAVLADHVGGEAAPVQEKQGLSAVVQILADGLDQRLEKGLVLVPPGVEHGGLRHGELAHPIGKMQIAEPAVFRRVIAGDQGRGGAQDHHGRSELSPHQGQVAAVVAHPLRLFVGTLVLLVDHDHAQPLQRREQGRAGADHDHRLAAPDAAPLVETLAVGKPGVQDGDAAVEAALEAADQLRGERDLRHQHQRALAGGQGDGDGLQIDLGLAASGDAVQEEGGEDAGGDGLGDPGKGGGLVRVERKGGVVVEALGAKGVAVDLALDQARGPKLHQPVQLRGAVAETRPERRRRMFAGLGQELDDLEPLAARAGGGLRDGAVEPLDAHALAAA